MRDPFASFRRFQDFKLENYYRGSRLTMGIIENKPDLVEEALLQGEDPNKRYSYEVDNDSITTPNSVRKITPIVQAAIVDSLPIAKLLVENGADVNMSQQNGETALANAVNRGNVELATYLLQHGADPNFYAPFGTPLALANGVETMQVLLEFGADPNIADADGDLPIIGAIDNNNVEEIALLVKAGTDLNHANRRGETPLDRARKRGNLDLLRM